MVAHVLDAGEVRCCRDGIVEKAQRDPSRHEMALDPGVFLGRLASVPHDQIGRADVAEIEQLAREDAPLDPPFFGIVDLSKLVRRGEQHQCGFRDLVVLAQRVHVREQIAGIVARLSGNSFEQFLGVCGLAVERDARLRDREVGAPKPAGHAQRGFVVAGEQALLHARLVVGAGEKLGIVLDHLLFEIGSHRTVPPRLADLRPGTFDVALNN